MYTHMYRWIDNAYTYIYIYIERERYIGVPNGVLSGCVLFQCLANTGSKQLRQYSQKKTQHRHQTNYIRIQDTLDTEFVLT